MHYLGTGSDRGCKGDKVLVRREEDGEVLRDRLLFLFRVWFRISLKSNPGRSAGLLHHMSQLMCNQPPSLLRSRRELARTKNDVVSDGVGAGVNVLCGLRGGGAGMHSHPAKILPETWLEIAPGRCVQRLPRCVQHLMYTGRCLGAGGLGRPRRLLLKLF